MQTKPKSPRTVEELVERYDRFITGCIFKVSRGHVRPDDIDDLRQQILLRVHERDYLTRYDPTKGSFNSYLYWLIRSVVVNQFEANVRNPLNTALGVVESSSELEATTRVRQGWGHNEAPEGYLVLEAFRDAVDDGLERQVMARDLADRFEQHLAAVARPWGPAVKLPDGTRARRSLVLIFKLLRQTFEVREVAAALGVSPQSVFGHLKRIRVEAAAFSRGVAPIAV